MLLGDVNKDDIIYCALPLYHTAGSMLGFSSCMLTGIVLDDLYYCEGLTQGGYFMLATIDIPGGGGGG